MSRVENGAVDGMIARDDHDELLSHIRMQHEPKAETARELDRVVVAADLHPRGQAAEEEEEGLPRGEAPGEARGEAPEISLIDACKTVPAEVVVRKMPRSAAPGGLTV